MRAKCEYISSAAPTPKAWSTAEEGMERLRARGPGNLIRDNLLKVKREKAQNWRREWICEELGGGMSDHQYDILLWLLSYV